jgi:hypothetical protein
MSARGCHRHDVAVVWACRVQISAVLHAAHAAVSMSMAQQAAASASRSRRVSDSSAAYDHDDGDGAAARLPTAQSWPPAARYTTDDSAGCHCLASPRREQCVTHCAQSTPCVWVVVC